MELSLVYFVFTLCIFLSAVHPTEVDLQCSTRHLLSFGGMNTPKGAKKTHHTSSTPKAASPPKYARSSDSNGLTVYVQPDPSKTLGSKVPSYSHILKPKLHANERKDKSKKSNVDTKKQVKKKKSTEESPSVAINKKTLVTSHVDKQRQGKALNRINSSKKTEKKEKQSKSSKLTKPVTIPKAENITVKIEKNATKRSTTKARIPKAATTTTALPINEKKTKDIKTNNQINSNEKKKSSKTLFNEPSENPPLTPPIKKNIPIKTSTTTPSPLKSSKEHKSKDDELDATTPTPAEQTNEQIKADEEDSGSVVGRAFHFVKNVFQLSDDNLTENFTRENHIIDVTSEYEYNHQSRKLLSINEDTSYLVMNIDTSDGELNLHFNDKEPNPTADDVSFVATAISKRQILAAKSDKQQAPSKVSHNKEKQSKISASKTNTVKPKVGWAYRYRISRYFAAQKMKQNSNKKKSAGEGKLKHSQQQKKSKQQPKEKKSSNDRKVSKRKLLEHIDDQDHGWNNQIISNDDIVDTVSITENFVPKRQLLLAKQKPKHEKNNDDVENDNDDDDDDDNDDLDSKHPSRRMQSLDESTDPIVIVKSYDRGLIKPRVGWQFRYRVSRYIESLRQNIREDNERLKLGLQDIKRKTPSDLNGKRKRVSDKPSTSHVDQSKKKQPDAKPSAQKNKTGVGWRYRYRISKMNEAKSRGEYIDDEKNKNNAKVEDESQIKNSKKSQDDTFKVQNDLDPELSQITKEGRRVGWVYRYRIRRKLDFLKQQQAEKGIPFDLATLSTKEERKAAQSKAKQKQKEKEKEKEKKVSSEPVEIKPKNKTQSVGWQYRYRVSKMLEAQKQGKAKATSDKSQTKPSNDKKSDKKSRRSTPVEVKSHTRDEHKSNSKTIPDKDDNHNKKSSSSSKKKAKDKSKKKDKDDEDEPGVLDYFRRASSLVLSGVTSTAKAPLCFLPLPYTFSFCEKENNGDLELRKTNKPRRKKLRKLRTKKEHRAKQFIRSHITKLGADDKATERRVDEVMKVLFKKPSLPPPQTLPLTPTTEDTDKKQDRKKSTSKRTNSNEDKKHSDKVQKIEKKVGVKADKRKYKKRHQIIAQEVKEAQKSELPACTFIPDPIIALPTTTASPHRRRKIPEVIQEEATTILTAPYQHTKTIEDINDEIDEVKEVIEENSESQFLAKTSAHVDKELTDTKENNAILSDKDDDTAENDATENA